MLILIYLILCNVKLFDLFFINFIIKVIKMQFFLIWIKMFIIYLLI